jgi:hypothetical protein
MGEAFQRLIAYSSKLRSSLRERPVGENSHCSRLYGCTVSDP